MSSRLETLPWLRGTPPNFASQCRSVTQLQDPLGQQLQALANFALDENQLNQLANAIDKARKAGRSLAPLVPFRVGILSNATADFLVPALVATAARHGIALECTLASYGQFIQESLSPESPIYSCQPDAILLAVDYRGYPLSVSVEDSGTAQASVEAALAQLQTVRSAVRQHSRAVCLVQNLAPPMEALFGSSEGLIAGTRQKLIADFNRRLADSIPETPDLLVDVAALAASVGLAEWHSPAQWNFAKLPFNSAYLPLYAEHVIRVIAAMRGKSRRVLIMDLDNTLWGGVIGDDGLEGIRVAQGDPVGEAYLSVQKYALDLRRRGVVLAVVSKNQDETARLPFRSHPEMLLREEHIAVFQANWDDKASNIKAVADELSLGLDSFVFLDDNPAERAIVREFLPQVEVPELPEDPALYVQTLSAAGYFEAISFSDEDSKRADFYQDNARRVALQHKVADMDTYLQSLQMQITFQSFDETGRARIAQLINKSNQYNLTTRRYTETDVAAIEQNPSCFTLQVRLTDIFGDNGMISVVVCRGVGDDTWEIDTWLMSCRVLGRRVERAVLQELVMAVRARGAHKLVGKYIPSNRNQIVADHYLKLGFTQVGTEDGASSVWNLDISQVVPEELPMLVCRIASEPVTQPASVN